MLKLRSIGLSDYSVLEGRQRVGRIRLATERMPCVWIWTIQVHLIGELPMGSAKDIDTVTAECEALKARFEAANPTSRRVLIDFPEQEDEIADLDNGPFTENRQTGAMS